MILFYVLVLLMPFLNPPFLSHLVSNAVAFKVLGAACLVYAVFHLAVRGSVPPYFRTWQARLFGVLYLWASVSFFAWGIYWRLLYSQWMVYTSFVGLLFVVLSIVDSLAKVRWVLLSAIGAVALASVRIMEEWWQNRGTDFSYRAGLMVGDSNYFATTAALCLPFAFLMVLHSKRRRERLLYGACLGLSLIGVTLCQSRGGTLAMGAALLHLLARSRRRVRNLSLVGVVVVPLMIFSPSSPLRRFLHPGNEEKNSEEAHIIAWKAGLRMIEAHPLAGVGLGNFKRVVERYMDESDELKVKALRSWGVSATTIAHNSYLEVAAELGLPALAVFASILFFVYRSLERARRRARAVGNLFLYDAARGLQAGFVGYLVGAFFISAQFTKLFWLVIFLSMCLPQLLSVYRTPQHAKPTSSLAPNPLRVQVAMGEGAL